jgi:hypothetical protein
MSMINCVSIENEFKIFLGEKANSEQGVMAFTINPNPQSERFASSPSQVLKLKPFATRPWPSFNVRFTVLPIVLTVEFLMVCLEARWLFLASVLPMLIHPLGFLFPLLHFSILQLHLIFSF